MSDCQDGQGCSDVLPLGARLRVLGILAIYCVASFPADAQPDSVPGASRFSASTANVTTEVSRNVQAFRHRDMARNATKRLQWEMALVAWDNVLALQPEDAEALGGKSQVLARLERFPESIEPLMALTRTVPGQPSGWMSLCWALIASGKAASASGPCEKSAQLSTDNYAAVVNLGHARLLNGRKAEAYRLYGRAVELILEEASLVSGPIADFDLFIRQAWNPDEARAARTYMVAAWHDSTETSRRATRKNISTLAQRTGEAVLRGGVEPASAFMEVRRLASEVPDLLPQIEYLEAMTGATASIMQGREGQEGLVRRLRALSIARYGDLHPDLYSVEKMDFGVQMLGANFAEAKSAWDRAFAISLATYGKYSIETAQILPWVSRLHQLAGRADERIQAVRQSFEIYENVTGPDSLVSLKALSSLADALAETQQAEAVTLMPRVSMLTERHYGKESEQYIIVLTKLGSLYRHADRYAEAVPLLKDALARSERLLGSNHKRTGLVLSELGLLLRDLGAPDRALPLIERAAAIEETNPDKFFESLSDELKNSALFRSFEDFPNLTKASVYRALGRLEEASQEYDSLASFAEKKFGRSHYLTVWARAISARLHLELGRDHQARDELVELLTVADAGGNLPDLVLIEVLSNVVEAFNRTKRFDEALRASERLLILVESGDHAPWVSAIANAGMATVLDGQGKREGAIFHAKVTVNRLQAMRGGIRSLDGGLQQGFLRKTERVYQTLASWLVESGRMVEAEQVLAMLKSQELYEITRDARASPPSVVSMSGAEAALDVQYRSLAGTGAAQATELAELRRKGGALDSKQKARRDQLEDAQRRWQEEFSRFMTSLQPTLATDARAAQEQRDRVQRVSGSLLKTLTEDSDRQSGRRHVALSYIVTDESVSILLTTPGGTFARQSPVRRSELNRRIETFRTVLRDPRLDPRPAAQALYALLIAPMEQELSTLAPQVLVLNLTDTLRYFPFAALHDGERYLVQRYALALYTSAVTNSVKQQAADTWRIEALGLTRPTQIEQLRFAALPAVRFELDAIVRNDANPKGALPGQMLLDERFTRESFEHSLAKAGQGLPLVMHVASHFYLVPGSDYNSFLVLGDEKPLRLSTIRQMYFGGVQMLTLSACDTGIAGGRNADGSEVEGLGAIAQERGAASVIASLWPVADSSTAKLMQRFYHGRSRGHRMQNTNAESLRQSQLDLLQGTATVPPPGVQTGQVADQRAAAPLGTTPPLAQPIAPPFERTSKAPFAHPYYWAAFVLMGNWL